ncbi:acyltransferase family protein [Rhodanobacter sp. BL-MT-08]
MTTPVAPAVEKDNRRIDDIEWLRAVAVLGVVVHHAQGNLLSWNPAWLRKLLSVVDMWSGVDIFFAISGFVIARSLLPKLRACPSGMGRASRQVGAFWVARAFRLLPSAWLWLGLILIGAWQFNRLGAFGSVHTNAMAALAGVFQVANFRFADAFANYPYGASFAYWSLSLEEQFYLVLPLVALLLRRHIAWLLVLVIVVQAIVPRTLLTMSLRTDALAWGVLLALASHLPVFARLEPRWLHSRRWLQRALALALVVAIAAVSARESLAIGQRVSLIAVLAVMLVWLAAYNRNFLSGPDSSIKRFMIWTGQRSYAIYLIHVPAFFFVRECWFRLTGAPAQGGWIPTALFTMAAAALIALLAECNFRTVERPLRRVGRRMAARIAKPAGDVA